MVLDQAGNLPTSSEVNLSTCDEFRLHYSYPENIDENRIVEDNLKGAEKSAVLDTVVNSNCGQIHKNEEMTTSSLSGLPIQTPSGDNTLHVETKTGEDQEESSLTRKTNGNSTLTEELIVSDEGVVEIELKYRRQHNFLTI
ncbi:unnamed protein product [Lepeophtheirus salmonis]|uniref:(salmon louse) hypothetical protein n=1 Tax=Lepeophtheirus salmonis TaxID=72036 RepID=A0A7R8H2X3_LEPSM|nr:unnamed protein product [Lepeophtheirus salmonis]CAF2820394.1 unnamed protein product [Lepeophtheirus salmonis]